MVSIHMLTKVAAEKSVFVYLYLKFLMVYITKFSEVAIRFAVTNSV